MKKYNFLYCQKIVVFSKDMTKVLLCKRKDEADYDSMFSFIGGKMEITDSSIIEGLKREKNEEVGANFKIKLYPTFSTDRLFTKKDGNKMILPHYFAVYDSGKISLNKEYSEYEWVGISELSKFEPKIPTVQSVVEQLIRLREVMQKKEFVII